MMFNNSTNINKANNHLSPELVEYKKKKMTTYDVVNRGTVTTMLSDVWINLMTRMDHYGECTCS